MSASASPASKPAHPGQEILSSLPLVVLLAAVPTFLLIVLSRSVEVNLEWHSRAYQGFLLSCSAWLSAWLGYWLNREGFVNREPALLAVAVGLGGLSLLFLSGAWWEKSPSPAWLSVVVSTWTVVFSGAGVLLAVWRQPRRACRRLLPGRGWVFWAVGLVVLLVVAAFSSPDGHEPFPSAIFSGGLPGLGLLRLSVLGCSVVLLGRLYWTQRKPVLLAFALALYLFGLAITCWMLAPAWYLLWWYAYGLCFLGLLLVAHAMLHASRVRQRDLRIAELTALSEKLQQQSVRDSLTDCFNRRYILDVLDGEYRKVRRTGLPVTLLVLDVDDFKSVNDTYGHPCGDAVLCELAARLRQTARTTDVLARCGGDEFHLVLPGTDRWGGQQLAAKLLSAVHGQSFSYGEFSIPIALSIGIADNFTPGVSDVTSLIQAADCALYSAKRAGKARVALADTLDLAVLQATQGHPAGLP